MKRKLNPIDWAFLQAESPERLAHVAGLWIFQLPRGYRKKFFKALMEGFEDWQTATPPFNLKLDTGALEWPSWVEDESFDPDYHIRHSTLAKPGTTEQLLELVERIHSHMLDRSRPLWECHFIEGIRGRQVAMYVKFHHALVDGISALDLVVSTLCKSPEEVAVRSLWQPPVKKQIGSASTGLLSRVSKGYSSLLGQAKSLPELSSTLAKMGLQALHLRENEVPLPFTAPKTRMNVSITARRRFAIKTLPLAAVKALGAAADTTMNNTILAICAGALRRYLLDKNELPKESLVAWVPVSIRSKDKPQEGNQVTIITCSLATDIEAPLRRFRAIKTSADAAKAQLSERSQEVSNTYTVLISGLTVLTQQLGLAERIAPPANLVISNVPGPRDTLYLNGARLVGQYPLSMLVDGQALNITITSHGHSLDFGVLACREAVPDVDSIANYLEDAFNELETALSQPESDDAHQAQGEKDAAAKSRGSRKRIAPVSMDTLIAALDDVPKEALEAVLKGEGVAKDSAAALQNALRKVYDVADLIKASGVSEGKEAGKREGLNGPDPDLMRAQSRLWNTLMDYYFRLEIEGWEHLPERPSLLIGIHSGGTLTMDAWTLVLSWWRRFEETRVLHGTAHDALMAFPGLGTYFRRMGTISPSRENMAAAFAQGDSVVLWPGGEVDALRSWSKRDKAVLGGRKGFIRFAIREGVPIVPVATVGGHDTVFILSEGRGIAKALGLKKRLRSDIAPIVLGVPFGITLELFPTHIPLPAKIRTELLEPVELDTDPDRVNDEAYVQAMYDDIESRIQAGMDRLAKRRKFPIMG